MGFLTKGAASKWLSVVNIGTTVQARATAEWTALLTATENSWNTSAIEFIVDSGHVAEACLGRSWAGSSNLHLQTPSSDRHNYALLKLLLMALGVSLRMLQIVRRHRSQQARECNRPNRSPHFR